jgi:hypothetical protein
MWNYAIVFLSFPLQFQNASICVAARSKQQQQQERGGLRVMSRSGIFFTTI